MLSTPVWSWAPQGLQVLMGQWDPRDRRASLALWESRALRAKRDEMGNQVRWVFQDQLD